MSNGNKDSFDPFNYTKRLAKLLSVVKRGLVKDSLDLLDLDFFNIDNVYVTKNKHYQKAIPLIIDKILIEGLIPLAKLEADIYFKHLLKVNNGKLKIHKPLDKWILTFGELYVNNGYRKHQVLYPKIKYGTVIDLKVSNFNYDSYLKLNGGILQYNIFDINKVVLPVAVSVDIQHEYRTIQQLINGIETRLSGEMAVHVESEETTRLKNDLTALRYKHYNFNDVISCATVTITSVFMALHHQLTQHYLKG